jgi:hypothetical protein
MRTNPGDELTLIEMTPYGVFVLATIEFYTSCGQQRSS